MRCCWRGSRLEPGPPWEGGRVGSEGGQWPPPCRGDTLTVDLGRSVDRSIGRLWRYGYYSRAHGAAYGIRCRASRPLVLCTRADGGPAFYYSSAPCPSASAVLIGSAVPPRPTRRPCVCAGVSPRPRAPSVVRGSYVVVVSTLAPSRCSAVQRPVPALPPALGLQVGRVGGRLVSPQRCPVVGAHALPDGAAGTAVVPAAPVWGRERAHRSSTSSGPSASGMASNMEPVPVL